MPEIELKPCPFCGEHNAYIMPVYVYSGICDEAEHKSYEVICDCCGASISIYDEYETQEEAAEAWNRRADEVNEPLTLEDLRKMDGEPSPGKYVVCWAKRNPFSGYMPMVAKVAANGFINPVTGLYITEIKNWAEIDMPDPPKEEK